MLADRTGKAPVAFSWGALRLTRRVRFGSPLIPNERVVTVRFPNLVVQAGRPRTLPKRTGCLSRRWRRAGTVAVLDLEPDRMGPFRGDIFVSMRQPTDLDASHAKTVNMASVSVPPVRRADGTWCPLAEICAGLVLHAG
jgi:hypothetical protein